MFYPSVSTETEDSLEQTLETALATEDLDA